MILSPFETANQIQGEIPLVVLEFSRSRTDVPRFIEIYQEPPFPRFL